MTGPATFWPSLPSSDNFAAGAHPHLSPGNRRTGVSDGNTR